MRLNQQCSFCSAFCAMRPVCSSPPRLILILSPLTSYYNGLRICFFFAVCKLRAPPKEDWVCACRPLPTPCYSLRSFLMTFCLPGRHQKMINFDCCFGFQQQIRNEPSKMPSKILMRMNVQKLCNKQEPIYLPRLPSQSLRVQWPFNCCSTLPCLNSAGSSCLVRTHWIQHEFQSPKAKTRHPWNDPNSEKLRQRNVSHQGSHQRGRWLSLIQINFGCPEIAESQGAALDHPILGLVSLPHRKKSILKEMGETSMLSIVWNTVPRSFSRQSLQWNLRHSLDVLDAFHQRWCKQRHSCLFTLRCTQTVPMTWNNQVFMLFISLAGNPKHPRASRAFHL